MVIHNTLFWNSGRGVIFAPVVASVYNPFAAVTLRFAHPTHFSQVGARAQAIIRLY